MINYILQLIRDIRQFRRMSHQEIIQMSTPTRQPLPASWADSINELERI